MLKLFYKNDGAITVFLVLILVPVITISSLFVDASRMRMAESVMASAADLTLETVLANYDKELNDYYGLMASSQDVDDFLSKTGDYLTAAMTANGLSDAEANSMLSAIYANISGDDNVDLLQLALEGSGDADGSASVVTKTANGDLTNVALVKKEITNFMKYRGPINLVGRLLDKFINIKQNIDETKKETERINKKNKFYETQSELLKKAYEVYLDKKEYVAYLAGTSNNITKYMSDMKSDMKGYREQYSTNHVKTFKDLYNSKNTKTYSQTVLYRYTSTAATDGTNTYSSTSKATRQNIIDLAEDYEDAIGDLTTADNNCQSLSFRYGPSNSDNYQLQFWVQTMEIIGNSTDSNKFTIYEKAFNAQVKARLKLNNALDNTDVVIADEEYSRFGKPERYGDSLEDYINAIKTDGDKQYNDVATPGKWRWEDYSAYLATCSANSSGQRNTSVVEDSVKAIQNEIKGYRSILEDAEDKAKDIANGCDDLVDLAIQYKADMDAWETAAENSGTPEAQTDLDVIHGENSAGVTEARENNEEVEELLAVIDEGDVDEMKLRYEAIESLLGNIRADFLEYKYFNAKLKDIGSYGKFKGEMNIDSSQIVIPNTQLTNNANSSFDFTEPTVMHIEELDTVNHSNNPDTVKHGTEFDTWLTDYFKAKEEEAGGDEELEDNVENAENQLEDIEEQGEDKADESSENQENTTSNNEIKDMSNRPSSGSAADDNGGSGESTLDDANSSIGDLVSDFTFVNNMERFYALDYIMSMFSYDTYEYEAKYKNYKKLGKTKSDLPTKESDASKYRSSVDAKWNELKDDVTFTGNKTLTNKTIDAEHNFAYGCEVEYILYGGSNTTNKLNAYGRIYLIRYAMNTVPIFAEYWKNGTIISISSSISGATGGIVPEPLIRIAILLALVAFESAIDISVIKQGMPVKFVKLKDDLYMKPEALDSGSGKVNTNNTPSGVTEVLDDVNAFFYSDYLILFIFSKMSLGGEDEIYLRTADVIQANMRKNLGNQDYKLADSQVYFTLQATGEVPALMMKLPINQGDSWDDLLDEKYKIEVEAVRGY